MKDKPNPGSDEAITVGCRCPVLDNGHGSGYLGDVAKFGFVINGSCPVHGDASFAIDEALLNAERSQK